MKNIYIYGTEAVGCYIGGRLLASGGKVRFVSIGRVPSDIHKYGLWLSRHDGRDWHIPSIAATFTQDVTHLGEADLVIFAAKAKETRSAARELATVLKPDATVLCLQQGVSNVDTLRTCLPQHSVLEMIAMFDVSSIGQGVQHLHQGSPGTLHARADVGLLPFLRLFSNAGLPLSMYTDMQRVQWAGTLAHLNDALNALANLPLREQFAQRAFRCCLALLQEEALGLLRSADIKPATLGAWPAAWTPRLLRLPNGLFGALRGSAFEFDSQARSGMSSDLAAWRATEVDWIQGDVVRLGRRLGRQAPMNERMCQLVHDAERSLFRSCWSGADLLAELLATRQIPVRHVAGLEERASPGD